MARLRELDVEKRKAAGRGGDFLEALSRGMSVIVAFNLEGGQLTLSEAARRADLPRASARRILHTLTQLGYLESDGKNFQLTPRILQLAAAFLKSNPLARLTQSSCDKLAAKFGEGASAAALDGSEVVMIAHASPPQRFSGTSPSPGFRLPSFCTALGRVLLSGFSDKELSVYLEQISLDAFTPHTVTDKQKLWEIIRQIRSDGYAVAEQEAEFGFRSIAVPVRRQDGRIVAAMNVGARVERVSSEALTAVFLPFLTNEAAYIQSLLP